MGGCTSTPVVVSNAPPPPRSTAAAPPSTGGTSSAPSSSSSSSVVAIAAITEVISPTGEEEEEGDGVVVVNDDDDGPRPANGTSAARGANDVAYDVAYDVAHDDDDEREEDLRRDPFPEVEDDHDDDDEENDESNNIATAAANDREVATTTTTTTSTYSRCHSSDTFSAEVDEEEDEKEEEEENFVVASANKTNETVIRDQEGLATKEEEEEGDDNNAATTTTLDTTITNKDEVDAEQTIETAEVVAVVVVVEGNDRILERQKNKKGSTTAIKETKEEARARKEAARSERLAQKRRIKEEATRNKKEKERLAAEEEVRLATIIEAERLEQERVAAEALAKVEALRVVRAEEERLAAEEMRLANIEADRLEQERRLAAEAMAMIEAQRLEREKVAAELEVARNAPILVDVHSSSMWDFRRPRAIDIQAAIAEMENMPSVAGSDERDDDDDDDFEVKDVAVVYSIPSEVATTVIVNGSLVKVVDVRPRLSFSQRGQEARTRAIARQKKILSRAGDRLEAISETSLTNIEEAPVYHRPTDYGDGLLRHRRALIMAGGSSSAGPTKSNHNARSIAASSTCASSSSVTRSVRRIVGDDGMERGEISSIVFYETGSTTSAPVAATNLTVGTNDASYLSSDDRGEEVDSPTSVQAYLDKSAVITPTSSMDERDESVDSSTLIGQDAFDVQFFVLLLCPESRIFELVDVTTSSNEGDEANSISPHSTINDILSVVSNRCTDSRLSTKEYIGFVRPDDRMVFTSTDKKAFVSSDESEGRAFIGENDLLVAILKNYTGHQISRISRPICRNTKFREMVRRRSSKISDTSIEGVHNNSDTGDEGGRDRSFGDESKSVRSSSDKKQRRKKHKLVKGGSAVVTTVDDLLDNRPDSNIKMKKKHSLSNEDKVGAAVYSNSLCQKLEQLSKKLNDVDDEIADEGDPLDETMTDETITELQIDTAKTTDDSIRSNDSFKMTSKMVAYELAMNIEEIFADHHVEIVAVDADEVEGGSDVDSLDGADSDDDETFFSSQSKRSGSQGMPSTLEFKTQRRRERRTDIYKEEEDDLMMQIEAMARNADAAFESRKRIVVESPTTFIDGKSEQINNDVTKGSDASTTIGVLDSSYDEDISVTTPNDITSIAKSFSKKGRRSMNKSSKKECDALSRNFLNTSTSMVSTMVASSQGRVNEVHVLQYLGVTIVCIAANFMDKVRARGATTTASSSSSKARGGGFGATEVVLQSAMFLAFVANGQRYMAKVTKK